MCRENYTATRRPPSRWCPAKTAPAIQGQFALIYQTERYVYIKTEVHHLNSKSIYKNMGCRYLWDYVWNE
jgi:hypothetical protein